jgi:predicted RNA-binding protein with PIN domain
MPYFLDGNNLIGHARGAARPSEEDRQSLIAEISDRLRATRAKAVLFFDGASGRPSSLGDLSIRDSGTAGADEAILREIERSRARREITVVTADRDLSRRARDAGASAISPREFWDRFGKRTARGGRTDAPKVDLEDWIRYFADEKNRQK